MPMYENLVTFKNDAQGIAVIPSYFSDEIVQQPSNGKQDVPATIERDISSNTFFVSGKGRLSKPVNVPFYTAQDSILIKMLEDTLHKNIHESYSFDNYGNDWKIYTASPPIHF